MDLRISKGPTIRSLITILMLIVFGGQAGAQIQRPATRPALKIADLERMLSQEYVQSSNDLLKVGWVPTGSGDSMVSLHYGVGEIPGQTNHTYYLHFAFKGLTADTTLSVSTILFMSSESSVMLPISSEMFARKYKLLFIHKNKDKSSTQVYDNKKYTLYFTIFQKENEGESPTYLYAIQRSDDSTSSSE